MILKELVSNDKSHIYVLYISIFQIGDFERPVTVEELILASKKYIQDDQISKDYIQSIIDKLIEKRILTKNKYGYRTIHRDWSRAFIEKCYSNKFLQKTVLKF